MYLNWDVLTTLFSHYEHRKDMLALMSTCHALRSAGTVYLLKFFVAILTDQHLASLCQFLLAGAPTRPATLKQLAIRTYPTSAATVEMYLRVLAGANCLRNFEVWCGSPTIDSRIYEAISRLPNLESLTIRNFASDKCQWLHNMQSPVRTVDISFQGRPVDPVPLLASLAPSLEKLRVVFACQGTDRSTVVYPHLRTLVTSSSAFEKIAPLVSAFPNLRDLTVFSCREEDDDGDELSVDRLENQQAQTMQCWEVMDRVLADVLLLYRLGLTCRVTRLEIPWLQSTYPDSAAPTFKDMFSTVLADTRPIILSLTIRPAFDISQFPAYMSASVPEELKKLIISLYITSETDIFATLVSSISLLSIQAPKVGCNRTTCSQRCGT